MWAVVRGGHGLLDSGKDMPKEGAVGAGVAEAAYEAPARKVKGEERWREQSPGHGW